MVIELLGKGIEEYYRGNSTFGGLIKRAMSIENDLPILTRLDEENYFSDKTARQFPRGFSQIHREATEDMEQMGRSGLGRLPYTNRI